MMAGSNLELFDVSGTPKLGLKGSGAAAWLVAHNVALPQATFEVLQSPGGGLTMRLGTAEFFLDDGDAGSRVARLYQSLESAPAGVYRVPREDASFLLAGTRAELLFSQTCGIDFRTDYSGRILYTRVAGVSCSILQEFGNNVPRYRLWLDPSFADYLWETLSTIVPELGGAVHPIVTRAEIAAH